MPPGKALQPVLRMKVDELFLRWLSDAATQRELGDGLRRIRGLGPPSAPAQNRPPPPPDAAAGNAPPRGGRGRPARRPPRQEEDPPPPAAAAPVPPFHFPRGRPAGEGETAARVDAAVARAEAAFEGLPGRRASLRDMGRVAEACGCPLYWKGPLFYGAGGERSGSVSAQAFAAAWGDVLRTCHDEASRFVRLLRGPGRGGDRLEQDDFVPFLQDVVDTHPGLSFLKEAPEFHSRYITTVIQRIFYTVNRSWSGRITCAELRRSTFLQNVARLEREPDINRLTEYFSYEHFYVIYCKFWELDADHDLLIDAQDLARHDDHALSRRIVDRIFSGAVTRGRRVQRDGRLGYADFVWFLLSEEDKRTPTSVEYWFRCLDEDGDGALSAFELERFYDEQRRRLDARGVEPLPFADCLCQMLDLVRPRRPDRITLQDLKRCKMAHVFFDTFFNVHKYLAREQTEQAAAPLRDDGEGPARTDWERYASEEYALLVAEEEEDGGDDEDEEPWEDGPAPC